MRDCSHWKPKTKRLKKKYQLFLGYYFSPKEFKTIDIWSSFNRSKEEFYDEGKTFAEGFRKAISE